MVPCRYAFLSILLLAACGCVSTPEPEPEAAPGPAETAEAAVAAAPDSAQAQYRYGNVLFDLGRFAEAAEAYKAATRLEPDYADAYTNLGLALRRLGHLDDAAEAYAQALQLQPDDLITLRNRKALAEAMNDSEGYADCVRRLAALLPEDVAVQREFADLLLAEEDYARAAALYEGVALAGLSDPDLFYNLGLCHFRLDRFDAAEAAWKKAVQEDVRHAAANRGLAVLYWTTGDYTEAWAVVSRCRQLDIGLDRDFLEMLRQDSGKQTAL